MKGLSVSVEEKAARYDAAIERAKNTIEVNQTIPDIVECVESLFPELKESEDERIRKEIVTYLKSVIDNKGYRDEIIESWIAWLEKQGEQKPIEEYNITGIKSKYAQGKLGEMIKKLKPVNEVLEQKSTWTQEDEMMLFSVIWHLRDSVNNGDQSNPAGKLEPWIRTLKDRVQPRPKQEWCEEDENMLESLTDVLKRYFSGEYGKECIDWLESFKERCTWKPSDEQMKILQYLCENSSHPNEKVIPTLESLYQDLKKLRKE